MTKRVLLVAVAVCGFLVSCSDTGEEFTSVLENSAWLLQSIEISPGKVIPISSNETYTLEFTYSRIATGRVYCNTYRAKYELGSDGSISFIDVTSTEMACPQPSNEGEFGLALARATSIHWQGNRLRLSYYNGARVLNFVRVD